MRGEHFTEVYDKVTGGGSSPLARGAPSCTDFMFDVLGIIPACAGSTWEERWL